MSWLSDLFSGGKKNKQVAADVYFPSQDPSYQLVKKNLEDIIAQRGLGYTPSVINSTTAPYATTRRENLKNYEVPLISSQASARGLGRSTIPVNRIALSSQEAERDIEQRLAEMIKESEQLKAQQYQNALSGMGELAGQEITAQNQARANAAQAQNLNRATAQQTTSDWLNKGLSLGATVLGGAFGGPAGAMLGSSLFNNTASFSRYSPTDWNDTVNYAKSIYGGAGVNIAPNPSPAGIFGRNLLLGRLPQRIGSEMGYRTS